MKRTSLHVDGPFLIGSLSAPEGTLESLARVEIFIGGLRAGTAVLEAAVPNFISGSAAEPSFFEFRLPEMPAESPVRAIISARSLQGDVLGTAFCSAASMRMARWARDAESAAARGGGPDLCALAAGFRAFAARHPVSILKNPRTAAAIARDLGILLCAAGFAGEAARLLSAPPVFACLRAIDAALFETLRIISDQAQWRDKRRLAILLSVGARRSKTADAFARRMRLAGGGQAREADAVWLHALLHDQNANPVLRAFAAETLTLHTSMTLAPAI